MKKTIKPRTLFKKKPSINFKSLKFLTVVLLILGIAGFAGSGYVWYTKIVTNSDRIFYGMIDKSLTTQSVVRRISQDESSRTENQMYYMTFSPNSEIQSTSTVEQIGQDRSKSAVTTDTIGTRTADYVKYTNIQIPKTGENPTDYSSVIGQWAKRDGSADSGQQTQFLNEAIFTFVPFGNFSTENRNLLMQILKDQKVYLTHDKKVSYESGRPVLNLGVSIKPRGLVQALKEYATLTGLGNVDLLDPTQYDDQNSFDVTMKIDVASRHLMKITYPGDTREEVYESYGLQRKIDIPKNTISVEELQSKLQ